MEYAGLVGLVPAGLLAAALWRSMSRIEKQVDDMSGTVTDMNQRLSRVEGYLDK